MGVKGRTPEAVIGRLASRAHGVVTRKELLAAGIGRDEIQNRLGIGSLIAVHRGVYRAGHVAPSLEAQYLAAVKACGEDALLAGAAAGHLWGIVKGSAPLPEVITRAERRVPGVTVHRARRTGIDDRTVYRGIPITTVPRTLLHLAATMREQKLARTCHEAGVLHGTTPAQVDSLLARFPSASGAGKLRRVLHGEAPVTLSRLEARFLSRVRAAGLPAPETNKLVDGRRVDCRWPARCLTIELDGYRYHSSRHAWELDRRREREARARGDEFRRYSWSDVVEDPTLMIAELHALLS